MDKRANETKAHMISKIKVEGILQMKWQKEWDDNSENNVGNTKNLLYFTCIFGVRKEHHAEWVVSQTRWKTTDMESHPPPLHIFKHPLYVY